MSSTDPKKKRTPSAQMAWHLVTNHMNALYILAAGLVMEPSGFRGKHYADSLGLIPGWIPLLRDVIPVEAIEQAVSERNFLRPCILRFDLTGVSCPVQVLSKDGKIRNAIFPKARLGNKGLSMLFRAPLPLTLLSQIIFRSEEDKQFFITAAKDVANIQLESYDIHVDETVFLAAANEPWPSEISEGSMKGNSRVKGGVSKQASLLDEAEEVVQSIIRSPILSPQALGGVLAVLYHTANQTDLGLDVFQIITGLVNDDDHGVIDDPILAELPIWLKEGSPRQDADPRAELFWGAVSALNEAMQSDYSSEPIETILEYLDTRLAEMNDELFRGRLERLTEDMRSTLGLGGATISELFERHKGSLSRPLLFFCLRKSSVELLEFSHPLFQPAERLLSAILFGVRDGWLKLPKEMRTKGLSDYVSYRMADVALEKSEERLPLPSVESPIPLRALFATELGKWSEPQEDVAIAVAKGSNWRECIQTIISSVDGTPLQPPQQHDGTFVFFGGVTSAVKIDPEVFLHLLGQWPPVRSDLDSMARTTLLSAAMVSEAQK